MLVIKNARLRRILGIITPIALIPTAVILGGVIAPEKSYSFTSVAVALLSLVVFFTGFERKKTGSRRLILCAVFCALSVAGRFIPFFKPVTALTMIAGMWLGGECGFLCGSMSALISNFYFGQGPWTPFQMLSWGLIGLLSGLLAAPMKKNRAFLCIMGALAGALFSMILDVWSVVWMSGGFELGLYLAAIVTALPHTLLYAFSNVIFLFFLAKPFGEKLARIKLKYGV